MEDWTTSRILTETEKGRGYVVVDVARHPLRARGEYELTIATVESVDGRRSTRAILLRLRPEGQMPVFVARLRVTDADALVQAADLLDDARAAQRDRHRGTYR